MCIEWESDWPKELISLAPSLIPEILHCDLNGSGICILIKVYDEVMPRSWCNIPGALCTSQINQMVVSVYNK